ncbi:MAG: hypothetical protein ACKO4Q_06395 [Planctomycetota bacterium]
MLRVHWLLAPLLGISLACAALRQDDESVLDMPPLEARVEHRVGALLGATAPTGAASALDLADALGCEVRATWFETAPTGGVPLAARAKLVTAQRGGEAIEPRSQLAGGARLLRGVEAQAALARPARKREVVAEELALPRGVTASLALLTEDSVPAEDGTNVRKELRAELGRAADGALELALVLEDLLAPGEDEEEADEGDDPAALVRRESLLLEDAPAAEGESLLFAFAPAQPGAAALVLVVTRRATATPAALERCVAQAREAEQGARTRTAWLGSRESRQRQIETALRALEDSGQRRAALLFLAAESGAELCADMALDAEDALLQGAAAALAAQLPDAARLAADGGTLGWALERGCVRFLAERASTQPLEVELRAAVLRRTGELGRSPAALLDVTLAARDLEDFRTRLIAENRVLLEDNHPAARVRAYDWLAARGAAPEGYDPLADETSREAALERAGGTQ